MIVVADTSPINYLICIDEIGLLPMLFGQIVVPPAVLRELSHSGAPERVRSWIAQPPAWLHVQAPAQTFDTAFLTASLDAGEQEALLLAIELSADRVIIDDMAARREAERLHLTVMGTIGILRAASALGLVDLRDALTHLRRTSFHLSRKLFDLLVEDAKN